MNTRTLLLALCFAMAGCGPNISSAEETNLVTGDGGTTPLQPPTCSAGVHCPDINGGFEEVSSGTPTHWRSSCGWGGGVVVSEAAKSNGVMGLRVGAPGCAVETPLLSVPERGWGAVVVNYRTQYSTVRLWLGWYDASGNVVAEAWGGGLGVTGVFARASVNIPRPPTGVALRARIISADSGIISADFDDATIIVQ